MERQGIAKTHQPRAHRDMRPAARSLTPTSLPIHAMLQLQQALGNQAVLRLLESRSLLAKLAVGRPGDVYEQEADRVAEQVMRIPEPTIQPRPT